MVKSSYKNREYTKNQQILKQKKGVNDEFAKRINNSPGDKCLIIDSFKEQTRTCVNSQAKYSDENIITIDRESMIENTNHYKMDLDEHLLTTNNKYHDVFADIIGAPKTSLKQIKPLFQRKLLSKGGIFAITCCLRGVSSKKFSSFEPQLFRLANKLNYKLNPINIPSYLRMNKQSTYKIKSNMSDNGGICKTGRTISAFYRVL